MSIAEIKEKLHQIIDASENEKLLEQIMRVMEQETKTSIDYLTQAQKTRLEKSIEQSKYPEQCIPHSLVKEEAAKWGKSK